MLVRTAADGHDGAALQAIGEADLIYLSGGHPRHLLDVLRGSPLGAAIAQANARGAVVAGCSAGAMAMVGRTMDFRQIPKLRIPLPFPIRWPEGLSLVNGIAVLPHYDAWPEPLTALVALQAPRAAVIVGIDEDTAVVGRRRRVAGPRPRARDGLARAPPRAVPQGRGVPDLTVSVSELTGRALDTAAHDAAGVCSAAPRTWRRRSMLIRSPRERYLAPMAGIPA